MSTKLESLRQYSTIVADTGEFDLVKQYRPQDCTTNPSLLFAAAKSGRYDAVVKAALDWGRGRGSREASVEAIIDRLAVEFGVELSKLVPGYVSTEVDAALSFDTAATVDKAHKLIGMYAEQGVGKERILIKTATTWEGVQAARQLKAEGIECNMTLVFGMAQAVACAEAGAFLISPFVGRILDWYKDRTGGTYTAATDPGVVSVSAIYDYFKRHGHKTVVMAASFRNTGEIEALAGCDRLTIAPKLLDELSRMPGEVVRALDPVASAAKDIPAVDASEKGFRWSLNQDQMATEKLSEGIRYFHRDLEALRKLIAELL